MAIFLQLERTKDHRPAAIARDRAIADRPDGTS